MKLHWLNATFPFLISIAAQIEAESLDSFSIDEEFFSESLILTTARLAQKPKDVPAGVTVITAETIRDLGISRLPEILRLVPGIRMTQASGWDYRINFHGTNGLIPRRMLLLVNGMAMHRYGFAEIDWNMVALDVNDIERIEVTRSPSSASYGSNAFQQVVNIITKHPQDVAPVTVSVEMGNNGLYHRYGSVSGRIKSTDMALSLSEQGDNGFDYVQFDFDKPPTPGAVDDHDVDRAVFRSNTQLGPSSIELNLGWVKSRVEDEEVDERQLAPPDRNQEDKHFQSIFKTYLNENHEIKMQAYYKQDAFYETWDACNPTIAFVSELRDLSDVNSTLAWQLVRGRTPTPSSELEQSLVDATLVRFSELGEELAVPICGTGNQNHVTNKRVLELEDTFSIGMNFRVNFGAGYQKNDITSETYSNGTVGSTHNYLFSNMEYLANEHLTINAGFMYESVSKVDDSAIAPRIGFNFHYSEANTVRVIYSTGKRMPNILETDRNWSYLVRNWDHEFDGRKEGKFFLTTLSPTRLEPETIDSFEVGLSGNLFKRTISYDARVFNEELKDLISEKGEFFNYNLTNSNSVDMSGFEAELKYRIKPHIEFSAGYSYIDSNVTNVFEKTLYSRHQGFASIVHDGAYFKTALTLYGQSELTGEAFDRTDLVITKHLKVGNSSNLDLQLVASYIGNDQVAYQWRENNRALHSFDESHLVKAKVVFSY